MTLPAFFRWPAIAAVGVWGGMGCGESARDRLPDLQPDATAEAFGGTDLAPELCPDEPVAGWMGAAGRANDIGYPDRISAAVTWTLVDRSGCVDTYEPSGTATYQHLIPGALCVQSIEPASAAIAPGDGELTIDRSTDPPTYAGSGATYWTVTFTCTGPTEPPIVRTFTGGAAWFDASGTVAGDQIAGDYSLDDPDRCGPEGIPPCTYTWSFTASM